MANTTTLSIKTDAETKALIQQAAERIGLSVNSFVIMVAKNAAEADEIIIRNPHKSEYRLIDSANKYNESHPPTKDWVKIKKHYGV